MNLVNEEDIACLKICQQRGDIAGLLDSRPGNQIPVTGKDLRAAIEAVLADRPVNPAQKPSLGCNIKWKAGNEPSSFLNS